MFKRERSILIRWRLDGERSPFHPARYCKRAGQAVATWSGTMTGSGAAKHGWKHSDRRQRRDRLPGFFTHIAATTVSGQPITVPVGKEVAFNPAGGTTTVSATLNVTGAISTISSGVLTTSGTLNNTGTVTVGAGTTLNSSGTVTQGTISTLTGGSWIASGTLTFPPAAPNILTLGPGASVTYSGASASFPKFANVQDIQGTLNILNKNFLGSAATTITNSGSFNINGGSFAQTTPRAFTQIATTILSNGASIASSISSVTINGGVFSGTGTVASATFTNNSGTVSPGFSPGILNISGNYVQGASGVLNIEVAGVNTATPDYDQLVISGSATLNGTLNVTTVSGFTPGIGQSFAMMTFASRSGDFATKNLPTINSLATLSTQANTTNYTLLGANFVTWDGGAATLNWADVNNWSNNTLPVSANNVYLDIPGTSTTTSTGAVSIQSLTSLETVSITAGSLTVAGNLAGAGTIQLSSGTLSLTGTNWTNS
ncbi:MAG: hypothetical protein WKF77_00915 [Planctomycetaceae bacterium]